jgi:hypothetical protein
MTDFLKDGLRGLYAGASRLMLRAQCVAGNRGDARE